MFYPGLHQPSDARHFTRCMVSVKRLTQRRSDFVVHDWLLDSGHSRSSVTMVTTDNLWTPTRVRYDDGRAVDAS